jgi:nicotinic acid mononucleotide adenylyltransferase
MAEKTQTFEQQRAPMVANLILDRRGLDPDDDYAILSRQYLRTLEAVAALEERIRQLEARLGIALLKAEKMNSLDDWSDADELLGALRSAAGKKGT